MITIAALLYGNYPDLARRCLEPISRLWRAGRAEIRLGCNEVSAAVGSVVGELFDDSFMPGIDPAKDTRPPVRVVVCNPQIYKYPMMRRLLRDPNLPVTTEWVMWFDDDSYIRDPDPVQWLDRLEGNLKFDPSPDMLGSQYHIHLQPGQRQWFEDQPWYAGRPIPTRVNFMTGGWWMIRSSVLERFDWPPPELRHRGGDVALGVLAHQQRLVLRPCRQGVAINADDQGKESASKRRGHDEKPIGVGYVRKKGGA